MQYRHSSVTKYLIGAFLVFYANLSGIAQVTILDARHYSTAFGEVRNYRIFLPRAYYNNPNKKFPVIYFLHGWSQRYFGSGEDNYAAYDSGKDNNGDNIEKFVAAHDVIVVKSDGYNHSISEPYYKRPYNVGPVETYRQFPVYFEELVNFIDGKYNTINDRNHRAVTGLSMGGFMAYLIGGKYPHLFSAVGSFCPSAEFFIGPKDFPVEYNHLYMYKNYGGTNVFLHYGDKDFIRSYHEDRNRIWNQVVDNYSYAVYPGEHSTAGLGDLFTSLFKTFFQPPQKPLKWDHIDLYPNFSAWDYQVSTDRNIPGFTILEKVNNKGFKSSIRNFLPDGEILSSVNMRILTPPVYAKNTWYLINDFDAVIGSATQSRIRSDNAGRLNILINGSSHEIGINALTDGPNISMVSAKIENMGLATQHKDVVIGIELINKGRLTAKNVKASLSVTRPGTVISKRHAIFGDIAVNERKAGKNSFVFKVNNDTINILKFKLTTQDGDNREWTEFFEVELKKDAPQITEFQIADGKICTVAKSGNAEETVLLGTGNGDGVANPGESIVLLVKDQGKLWRTALQNTDEYVNPFGIHMRESDSWESFDYVGGSAKYSISLIAANCPRERKINFYGSYWVPGPERTHQVKEVNMRITVDGYDLTPPAIAGMQVTGDNIIQARVVDGAPIKQVTAMLSLASDPEKKIVLELKDDGKNGDRVAGDHNFSYLIPSRGFGWYTVIIEATDALNNKTILPMPGTVLLH